MVTHKMGVNLTPMCWDFPSTDIPADDSATANPVVVAWSSVTCPACLGIKRGFDL